MERLRRVASVWSWLPAFRAVAETQHLPTASQQLFVSASALSRTIRLLEDELGQRLFLRNGRRIELNEAGQRFLVAVRSAMRLVHDGLLEIEGTTPIGPIYVSAVEVLASAHVLPALASLRARDPGLVLHLRREPADGVVGALLRGQLDVAFVTHPPTDPQLAKTYLGRTSRGIRAGRSHPLAEVASPSLDHALEHPFVAAGDGADNLTGEGWPPALSRRVSMYVPDQAMAVEMCASGGLLAVLPDALLDARLCRLALDAVPPADVFALTRQPLGEGNRASAVVDAVRATLDAAVGPAGAAHSGDSVRVQSPTSAAE
jgi:DNA-binding transcriptional LysR family regulator